MFNLFREHRRKRAAARRRTPVGSGLSRRLTVETLEGRLMLSATSLDLASLSSPAPPLSLQTTNQLAYVATQVEDGYITVDFSGSGTALGSIATQAGTFFQYSGATQDLISSRTFLQINSSAAWKFDAMGAISNGIRPVAIVATDSDASFQNFTGPTLLGNSETVTHREEGGAIPIESILARLPALGIETGGTSVTLTSVKSAAASQNIERSTASSAPQDAVIGEWARAVVFETAGGEPKWTERSATQTERNNSNSTPNESSRVGSQPLSHSAPNSAVAAQGIENVATARDVPTDGSSGATNAVLNDFSTLPQHQSRRGIPLSFSAVTPIARLEPANVDRPANSASNAAILGADYAEAFAQLGELEESTDYSLVADYTRRVVVAMPLLTLLALERITARNSRRENKEPSADPLWRPMLAPDPSEDNPDRES